MSRYLELKKSFEAINNRGAEEKEKILLCSLSLLRKVYDMNYIQLREERRRVETLRTSTKNREFLQSKKKRDRMLKLETTIYRVSKATRKWLGFEIADRNIPPAMDTRRSHESQIKNRVVDALEKSKGEREYDF